MEFSLITPDKLKVSLSRDDLATLGIDGGALDYSDARTRQVLLGLLDQGRTEAGFHPKRSKLYIEVFPGGEGGCVIYYTRLCGGEVLAAGQFAPGPVPVIFAFSQTDILLRCCKRLLPLCGHRIYKSALYRLGGAYRLVVWPLDFSDQLSVTFLSEFGRKVGEGSMLLAYVEEHGSLLLEGDAVEILAVLD